MEGNKNDEFKRKFSIKFQEPKVKSKLYKCCKMSLPCYETTGGEEVTRCESMPKVEDEFAMLQKSKQRLPCSFGMPGIHTQ